jgi:4-diphosphocytidyl-2-C-methyl-D-erythritol kinase
VNTVKTRCPAKVNLTFEILGTLPDGYHEVRTLMQSVSLEDELTFHFSPGDGDVSFQSVDSKFGEQFPADKSNLIVRAIEKFQQTVPESKSNNVAVQIIKRIPIGAGLAGGSANAAAAIVAINHYHNDALSLEEIMKIGASLGADIPFCIKGGTCVGSHKGDVLAPSGRGMNLVLLLAKPHALSISTPWAFKEFDQGQSSDQARSSVDFTEHCADVLKCGTLAAELTPHLVNDLERVVFRHYNELEIVRQKLEEFGALGARLTGSGPTLYGLFSSRAEAEAARKRLNHFQEALSENDSSSNAIYPFDSWIAESIEHGARVVD